jgi:hypothetical protein
MGSFRPCPPHLSPRHAPTECVRRRVSLVQMRPDVTESGVHYCVRSDSHRASVIIALSGTISFEPFRPYYVVQRSPAHRLSWELTSALCSSSNRTASTCPQNAAKLAEYCGTDPANPHLRHARADIERRHGAPSMTQVAMACRSQSLEH